MPIGRRVFDLTENLTEGLTFTLGEHYPLHSFFINRVVKRLT